MAVTRTCPFCVARSSEFYRPRCEETAKCSMTYTSKRGVAEILTRQLGKGLAMLACELMVFRKYQKDVINTGDILRRWSRQV